MMENKQPSYFTRYLTPSNIAWLVLGAATYFLIDFLLAQGIIDSYYEQNLVIIFINIILAVSLNLINGFTGQFSIGHAGFMAIGAYASAVLTLKLGQPFPLAILVGALAAAAAGLLIGIPTLRLKGDYLAIATIGFGEIIRVLFQGIDYVGGPAGLNGIKKLTDWPYLFAITMLTILVVHNLIRSSYGRACLSIRENEIAAETMGVNITFYKVLAFTIGAFFAGAAGSLHAHYFYTIQPGDFGFLRSIDILVIVVLGGLGSITGSVIAAILLTVLSVLLQSQAELRMLIYSLILILIMIFRPSGIMGYKELSLQFLNKLKGAKDQ